ncbi:MAG TPA: hypothetical protein IAC02_04835 [Candidatus Coprovivens excrementavium]|nr:hypothetical protein [Candidatus Coprovivens excrementavium]
MKLNDLNYVNDKIDVDKYIEYRENVKKEMKEPDWLGDFSKDDILYMLDNNSKIWMYFKDEEFICSMMLIPSTKKDLDKFGIDLDFNEVVDYGPMFVNPKYVGNSLQYQMLKELDEYSSNKGYKYAISTVHPNNIYSINNLIRDGFELVGYRIFTRGERNIYYKKL